MMKLVEMRLCLFIGAQATGIAVQQVLGQITSGLTTSCCFPIFAQVPPVHSAPLAFISFSAKGTTINLEERQSVMIWNTDSIVFVQTDKPIYKPGQTGECPLCL